MILVDCFGNFGKFIFVVFGFGVIVIVVWEIYLLLFNIVIVLFVLRRVFRVILVIFFIVVMVGVGIFVFRFFVFFIIVFLFIIGYYFGGSVICYLIEYLWFCGVDLEKFDFIIWDDGKVLLLGFSVIVVMLVFWVFIIFIMDQIWFIGLIVKFIGDLGFEFVIIVFVIIYIFFWIFEVKRWVVL